MVVPFHQPWGRHPKGLSSRRGWFSGSWLKKGFLPGYGLCPLRIPGKAQTEALWACVTRRKFAGGFPANSHEISAQVDINLALGGNLGHTGARGLQRFLTRCVLRTSANMDQAHVAPRTPTQGSFPGAEFREGV